MYLFSLMHRNGFTQLGIETDINPRFVYKDDKNNEQTASDNDHPQWNSVNIADGKWHKLAWSVYTGTDGSSVVELYLDCKYKGSRRLVRNASPGEISTEGIFLFGQNGINNGGEFEGDIQQLDLYDDSTIAQLATDGHCRANPEYTIQCDNPNPANSINDNYQAVYEPDSEYQLDPALDAYDTDSYEDYDESDDYDDSISDSAYGVTDPPPDNVFADLDDSGSDYGLDDIDIDSSHKVTDKLEQKWGDPWIKILQSVY